MTGDEQSPRDRFGMFFEEFDHPVVLGESHLHLTSAGIDGAMSRPLPDGTWETVEFHGCPACGEVTIGHGCPAAAT